MSATEKSCKMFKCSSCDYTTSRKSSYDKHILTAKHIAPQFVNENCGAKFECKTCDYITFRKDTFQRHLQSVNHMACCGGGVAVQKKYECDCGKSYNDSSGLWRHKKKCDYKNNNPYENTITDNFEIKKDDIIQVLLKENSEMKKLMQESMNKMMETQNKLIESHSISETRMIDFMKNQSVNNICNNNLNSHNNTFNLQVFLNETCKNAMNFSDFVKGIQTDLKDVEYVGKNGYVNGISNIVIRSLSNMKVEERPLHCTDQRRETIYIKENDVWEKEDLTLDNNKMLQLVRDVSLMNAKNVHIWRDNYPQCLTAYSDKTDQYNYIVHEALGGDTKYTTKQKEEKIISKILKCILIDKK
jgi:hypothetical protein